MDLFKVHTRATQVQARATCGDSIAFRSLVPLATTNKRQAIAPAYSACLYAYVTSVKEAVSSKSPEESEFFYDNSRACYIGRCKVHRIFSMTP